MKNHFLKFMQKELEKKYSNKDKIDEIMYGIEGLYLTLTKAVIIIISSLILGVFKGLLCLLIFYNFVRLFAFGMHASKSWHCLVFSLIVFVFGSYLCEIIIIPKIMLFTLYLVSFLIFIIYAPADTEKRPLIKKKKRIRYKILSVVILFFYFVFSLFIKNNLIINAMVISSLIESILILPVTYKIFKLPYKNYKTYGLNTI